MSEPDGKSDGTKGGSRRGLLVLGGAVALVALAPPLFRRIRPRGDLPPHPDVPGFLMGNGGEVTAPFDPFAGIAAPDTTRIKANPIGANQVCDVLFRDSVNTGAVPVAFFTDINCPYCRIVEGWLSELPADKGSVSWHDLPLLGPSSVAGARAIGSARLHGADADVRKRLHRTQFQPDAAYLGNLARGLGIAPDTFLAGLQNPLVEQRIADSIGLAEVFGIFGTPALVIGRVLVIGAISKDRFNVLLASEARDPESWPCASPN